jgi:RimJ/RimL family protein N-acetyltransferase
MGQDDLRGQRTAGRNTAPSSTMVTLGSGRLLLRMFRESDLDAYAAMCGDAEVMRYLGGGYPLSRAESWRNMALVLGHWHLRGFGLWAVEERATGLLAGRVGCWQPEGWPGLEIGWTLRREFWDRGYATEAARTVLADAFSRPGNSRLISLIHPQNERSIAVALRLGMRRENDIEILGHPACLFGVDRSPNHGV